MILTLRTNYEHSPRSRAAEGPCYRITSTRRGTAVMKMSKDGRTPQKIAAITPYASRSGLDFGANLARTRPLAESAIRKLEEHRRNKNCKPDRSEPAKYWSERRDLNPRPLVPQFYNTYFIANPDVG